jgi:hypothetical protein
MLLAIFLLACGDKKDAPVEKVEQPAVEAPKEEPKAEEQKAEAPVEAPVAEEQKEELQLPPQEEVPVQ